MRLTEGQFTTHLCSVGIPENYAPMLAYMDTQIAHGSENRLNDVVEQVTGKKPRTFRDFAIENKQAWI